MDETHPTIEPDPLEPLKPVESDRIQQEDVFCGQCGYNLHGLTPQGNCPECGRPIEPPKPTPEEMLEREDVFCGQCGYNLHGLTPWGNCPECGTPVERSLRGNLLLYSSPEYLKRLHQGNVLVIASIIANLVFVALLVLVSLWVSVGAGAAPPAMRTVQVAGTVAGVPISLVALIGWWFFSAPDPAFVGIEPASAARKVLRAALAAQLLITVGHVLHLPYATPGLPTLTPAGLIEVALMLAAMTASVIQLVAAMLYLRWLTPRLPDASLFRRSKTYAWLLPTLTVAGAPCCGFGPLLGAILLWRHLEAVRRHIKCIRLEAALEFADDGPTDTARSD